MVPSSAVHESNKFPIEESFHRPSIEPWFLTAIVDGLYEEDSRLRNACAAALRKLSERWPAALYPVFNSMVDLLTNPDVNLRFDARFILEQMAHIDTQGKLKFVSKDLGIS